MKRLISILIVGVLLGAGQTMAAPSDAGQRGIASGPSFDAFRIVVERNIFSANRRRGERTQEREARPRPPAEQRISLLGAWIDRTTTGSEAVAFFMGSEAQYNKRARTGDTIAGFRVCDIRTDRVRLEQADRSLDLPVGMALTRQEESEWRIASAPLSGSPPERISTTREGGATQLATNQTATTGTVESSSPDDVLKKLMERRRRETRNE